MSRTPPWSGQDPHAAALDERLARSLRPIAFVLGAIYLTSVAHRAGDPVLLATTAPTAIVPAVLVLVLGALFSLRPLPPALANPVVLLTMGLMTAETLGRGEPAAGANLHWALIAIGAVVLRTRWFAGTAATVLVPWAIVAALDWNTWSLSHDGFMLHMGTATALGTVIFTARRRDVLGPLALQAELVEARSVYRRVLAVLQDGVVRLDGDGRVVRMNPSAERILGVSEQVALGLTPATAPWTYVAPDGTTLPPDGTPSSMVRRTGEPVSSVLLGIRRTDGVTTWVTENAAPGKLRDDGSPDEIIVSLADVTPLRDALEAASRSEKHVREVVDSAGDAILLLDGDGRVTFANPAVSQVSGYPDDEIVGMLAIEAVDERDRERVAALLAGLGDEDVVLETRIRRPDGGVLWLEVRARLLPAGVLELVGRDITPRRVLEAERDRLALAVEQSSDAVVLADLDGYIVYVNEAFERMHGVTRAEVTGQRSELWGADDGMAPDIGERLATVRATGRWSGDVVYGHSDGSSITAATRMVTIRDDDGNPTGYLGLITDVSRERALEASLARAARMEAIGQLAGGVAHDFNNLLTAVLGHAELATDEAVGMPGLRAELAEITRAGERAQALTRQLLAFGRRSLLRPRTVDVGEVAAGLEPMLRRLIGEDVALIVDPGATPGLVEVDASLLEHAIVNLAVNARDAMPEGGLVHIATGVPGPGDDAPEGLWAAIRISDTGPGIPPEVVEHMFEPFFSTKPDGQGTGLGLAMVHGFVDQSGGHVRVRTNPDLGTSFTILLPMLAPVSDEVRDGPPGGAPAGAATGMTAARVAAATGRNGPEPRPRRDGSETGRGTVLVAEDESVLRAIAERALQNAGYRVLLAESGERAVRLAAEHVEPIDLLFTDIVMPGIHGVALARSMCATRPEIRVLITSGYTQDDVVRRGVDLGDIPFLAKPYTPSGLVAAVEAALGEDLATVQGPHTGR